MKRRVVLHGPSTLTVSLPSGWVKKFNVKKGDELNLEENGKELRVCSDEKSGSEKKQIKIGNLERLGKSEITSSYRKGYDELSLEYDDAKYIETVQEIISKEIMGFEIIKHGKNYCVIKDLAGHNKDEFDTALRRLWLLTLDIANESLDALKKKDNTRLKNIKLIDCSINKFSNYCLRLLAKRGYADFKKNSLYCHLIKCLEEIADQYKDMCNFYQDSGRKINSDAFSAFAEVNNFLNEFYELFYKYDREKTEEFFNKTKRSLITMSKSKDNSLFYPVSICKDIRNLASVLVEINI